MLPVTAAYECVCVCVCTQVVCLLCGRLSESSQRHACPLRFMCVLKALLSENMCVFFCQAVNLTGHVTAYPIRHWVGGWLPSASGCPAVNHRACAAEECVCVSVCFVRDTGRGV